MTKEDFIIELSNDDWTKLAVQRYLINVPCVDGEAGIVYTALIRLEVNK